MNITLEKTAEMMLNTDYKQRFLAEYWQIKIRVEKLQTMLTNWSNGTLSFKPLSERGVYEQQLKAMNTYAEILEFRAQNECIDLETTADA